jgi:hypothetical protein
VTRLVPRDSDGDPAADSLQAMATTGEDPDDPDTDDSPPAPARRSGTRPAPTRSAGPSRSSRSAATPAPTKWAIDRLDSRERAFSFTASAFAVLFSVFIGFLAHIKPPKGQLHPETIFIVGMVGAALLLGATFLGRRAPVGFVALFIGASFAQSVLFLGLPFFALAFWLLYRSFRVQKEITAQMRASRSEAKPSASTRSRSSSAAPPSKSSAPKKAAPVKKRSKGPVGPTPNKRYTPKTPSPAPPPPPKLSRRERKAAASQD